MAEQEKQEETPEQEAAPAEGGAAEAKDAEQPQGAAPAEGEQQNEPAAAPAAERRPARAGEGAAPAGPSTAVVAAGRPGQPAVSRRSILRFGFWSGLGAIVAGMAACGVDMLYPRGVAGFGGRVSVDPGEVPQPGEKRPIQRGRFWLVNLTEEQGGPGLLALWWKCPHLGCTVPWKEAFIWPDDTGSPKQGWFRCPCHGSTYTDAGVRVFGPAPRSLDTFNLTVENGRVSVETGKDNAKNGGPDNPDRAVRI